MAAVLLGNLALLFDANSPRNPLPPDRTKNRHSSNPDPAFYWLKRESNPNPNPNSNTASSSLSTSPSFAAINSSSERENRNPRMVARRRASSKAGAVNFDSSGVGDGGGNGDGKDWEEQLRRRLKELEEMKELERRAEELQRNLPPEEGGGEDETEEEKRNRVRRELEKVAKEQAERRETAKLMFELGQKAYGRGMYSRATEFLEGALTIIPRPTFLGGEIQIWLAMAYEANNRHRDCIALYQQLEKKHPSVSIRRQAAELRYILQAPKLKISKDEMVTIPLIGSSYDSYAGTWTDKYKDRDQRRNITTNQLPSSRDFLGDFLVWRPPTGLEKNRVFWVAVTLWFGFVGVALLLHS